MEKKKTSHSHSDWGNILLSADVKSKPSNKGHQMERGVSVRDLRLSESLVTVEDTEGVFKFSFKQIYSKAMSNYRQCKLTLWKGIN